MNNINNSLEKIIAEDKRSVLGKMPYFKKTPITIVLVSNIDKMIHHSDEFRRNLYSSMDVGYISQNIYLHCAASNLATCACGLIDREGIATILGLSNSKVMLAHPISIRKEKKDA